MIPCFTLQADLDLDCIPCFALRRISRLPLKINMPEIDALALGALATPRMTAIVNYGVPVVLITTPQFYKAQASVERYTGWRSEQFIGRVSRVVRLPDSLPVVELKAIARAVFPEGDARCWEAAAQFVKVSRKRVAAIKDLADLARWKAAQSGHAVATASDLSQAIKESASPMDSESLQALATPPARVPRRPIAQPLPSVRNQAAGSPRAMDQQFSTRRKGDSSLVTG